MVPLNQFKSQRAQMVIITSLYYSGSISTSLNHSECSFNLTSLNHSYCRWFYAGGSINQFKSQLLQMVLCRWFYYINQF